LNISDKFLNLLQCNIHEFFEVLFFFDNVVGSTFNCLILNY
jgi:hypothetical protein